MQASNLHLQQASKLLFNLGSLLQSFQNNFEDRWRIVTQEAQLLGIDAPIVACTRGEPRHADDGADAHRLDTREQYSRQQFITLIDAVLGGIESHFAS